MSYTNTREPAGSAKAEQKLARAEEVRKRKGKARAASIAAAEAGKRK